MVVLSARSFLNCSLFLISGFEWWKRKKQGLEALLMLK